MATKRIPERVEGTNTVLVYYSIYITLLLFEEKLQKRMNWAEEESKVGFMMKEYPVTAR